MAMARKELAKREDTYKPPLPFLDMALQRDRDRDRDENRETTRKGNAS